MSEEKIILSARVGNNDDLIRQVVRLYAPVGSVVADVTYGNGVFWKQVDLSLIRLLKSDLKTGVDFRALPYSDESVDVVVLDPPYTYNPKGTIKESISVGYRLNESGVSIRTTEDVLALYSEGLGEAVRVVRHGGTVWVKCKDGIESGKQRWEHIRIFNIAASLGLRPKDLFVLIQTSRPAIRWKNQKHARKNHSYLWVFEKKG